jgi:hypothetical protein
MDAIDWNQVAIGLGNGLATSLSVLGAVNLIGIPVSYVANRFIYHSKGMRVLLSIVSFILSIPLLFGMIIYSLFGLQKAHYFGYLPFIVKSKTAEEEKAEAANMSWIESLISPIWAFIRDVLFAGFVDHRDTPEDRIAFEQAGGAILVPIEQKGDPTKVILEKVMVLAQQAAQAVTKEKSLRLEGEAQGLLSRPTPAHSVTDQQPDDQQQDDQQQDDQQQDDQQPGDSE